MLGCEETWLPLSCDLQRKGSWNSSLQLAFFLNKERWAYLGVFFIYRDTLDIYSLNICIKKARASTSAVFPEASILVFQLVQMKRGAWHESEIRFPRQMESHVVPYLHIWKHDFLVSFTQKIRQAKSFVACSNNKLLEALPGRSSRCLMQINLFEQMKTFMPLRTLLIPGKKKQKKNKGVNKSLSSPYRSRGTRQDHLVEKITFPSKALLQHVAHAAVKNKPQSTCTRWTVPS